MNEDQIEELRYQIAQLKELYRLTKENSEMKTKIIELKDQRINFLQRTIERLMK